MLKLTQREIDKIAIKETVDYEIRNGRSNPIYVNKPEYDISSGDRFIEVKGTTHNYGNIGLKKSQYNFLKTTNNWYLYLVVNIGTNNIKLYEFTQKEIEDKFNDWLIEYKIRIPLYYLEIKI